MIKDINEIEPGSLWKHYKNDWFWIYLGPDKLRGQLLLYCLDDMGYDSITRVEMISFINANIWIKVDWFIVESF